MAFCGLRYWWGGTLTYYLTYCNINILYLSVYLIASKVALYHMFLSSIAAQIINNSIAQLII